MAKQDDLFYIKEGSIYTNKEIDFIVFNENVEDTDNMNKHVFLFGSVIIVHDSGSITYKMCTLSTRVIMSIYSEEQFVKDGNHTIIKYLPGDKVIESTKVLAALKNVVDLFNNLLSGNVSPLVHYTKYYDILMNCMKFNRELGFPKVLIEIMIAEMFLDNTGTKPVRLNGNPNDKGIPSSIGDLVQIKNTFNSMTFEDPAKAILINKGKTDEQQDADPSTLETYYRK